MLHRCISVFVSFLLLASHMNLTIGTHFCGGQPIMSKIIFGNTHLGCGMSTQEAGYNSTCNSIPPEMGLNNIPCCKNHYKTMVSDGFLREAGTHKANLVLSLPILSANTDFCFHGKSGEQQFSSYSFPPFCRDVQLLFQVFLI